jgi:hypothetical protein
MNAGEDAVPAFVVKVVERMVDMVSSASPCSLEFISLTYQSWYTVFLTTNFKSQ